jgi:hypothetical protein
VLWRETSPRARARSVLQPARLGHGGKLRHPDLCATGRPPVEILADRGIAARVAQAEWDAICRAMEASFRGGEWRRGALRAVARAGALLASHFPAGNHNPNELPDQPLVL